LGRRGRSTIPFFATINNNQINRGRGEGDIGHMEEGEGHELY